MLFLEGKASFPGLFRCEVIRYFLGLFLQKLRGCFLLVKSHLWEVLVYLLKRDRLLKGAFFPHQRLLIIIHPPFKFEFNKLWVFKTPTRLILFNPFIVSFTE